MKASLQTKALTGFALALIVPLVLFALSFGSFHALEGAHAWEEHTLQVLTNLTTIRSDFFECQGAARGYLLDPSSDLRAIFDQKLTDLERQLDGIGELTKDNPRQQARIKELTGVLHLRLGQLTNGVALADRGDRDGAVQAVAGKGGRDTTMEFRRVVGIMANEEQTLLLERNHATLTSGRRTLVWTGLGCLVSLSLISLSGWMVRKDMIARARAEAATLAARKAAEDANRSKSDFLANMSHEIRTPVSAIIGYGDLLLDPELDLSDRLNCVNTIRRNAAHLLTIINDILDLAKVESGQLEVERVECSPCQSVSDVASMMRVRAVEKNLLLEVRVEGRIPKKIRSDPTRLRQILLNLVSNAIKFTDAGWVRMVLKVATDPGHANPRLRFEVIDTGIGMSSEQMGRIFKPFVQGDSSTTRLFGGTGLGLVISRRLAHKLGGDITVESAPGRGSVFSLEIETGPLSEVPFVDQCTEALAGELGAKDTMARALTGRILLAEDGLDNRALISLYLTKAGAAVEVAENGRIACEKVLNAAKGGTPYDVVLMDMQMPELDGYGATSRLRSLGYKGTIIALTAHAMAQDRQKCLNAGCTDYLSKPIDRAHLLKVVGQYLQPATTVAPGPGSATVDASTSLGKPSPSSPARSGKIVVHIDPEIAALVPKFLDGVRMNCDTLASAAAQRDFSTIRKLAHQIAGAGGSYGFDELTRLGQELEAAAEAGDDGETVRRVNDLREYLERLDVRYA